MTLTDQISMVQPGGFVTKQKLLLLGLKPTCICEFVVLIILNLSFSQKTRLGVKVDYPIKSCPAYPKGYLGVADPCLKH